MFHFSLPLPLRFPHPLDRVSTTNPDRFATLSRWANRSFFLPKLHRGSHFLLLIRGSAGGCVACVLPGVPPFSGGSGACRRWGDDNAPQGEYPEGLSPLGDSLVTFSSGRKSPGCRAERLQVGAGTTSPAKIPGVGGAERPLMGERRGVHRRCGPSHWGLQGPPCKRKGKYCVTNRDFCGGKGLCIIKKKGRGNRA